MIRELIEAEMERREWTAYRLAKEAGIPERTAYGLAAGRAVRLGTLEKVLAALNIKVTREE